MNPINSNPSFNEIFFPEGKERVSVSEYSRILDQKFNMSSKVTINFNDCNDSIKYLAGIIGFLSVGFIFSIGFLIYSCYANPMNITAISVAATGGGVTLLPLIFMICAINHLVKHKKIFGLTKGNQLNRERALEWAKADVKYQMQQHLPRAAELDGILKK